MFNDRHKGRAKIEGLDARLRPLQREAAGVLLAHFAIPLLPQRLVTSIDQFDLMFALMRFSSEMGVTFDSLLSPARFDHEAAAQRLRRAVSLLIAIEEVSTPDNLDSSALISMLSGDLSSVETGFRQLQECNALHALLSHTAVPFPAYQEFVSEVRSLFGKWIDLSGSDIEEIAATFSLFLELNETYQSVSNELDNLFGGLKSREAELGGLLPVVANMAEEYLRLKGLLEHGEIPPDEGIAALIELLENVRIIAGRIGHEDAPTTHSSAGDARLQECLAVLGVRRGATKKEVRKAYRLMVKRLHPDVNKDPSATEKFLVVQRAYEWLLANHATD